MHFHQLFRLFSERKWRTEPKKKGRKRGGIRSLRKSRTGGMGAQDMVVTEASAHTMWHVEQFSLFHRDGEASPQRHRVAEGDGGSSRSRAPSSSVTLCLCGERFSFQRSVIAACAGSAELAAAGCRLRLGGVGGGLQRERGRDLRGVVEWGELDRCEDEAVRAAAERA